MDSYHQVGITPESLGEVFPFHFVLDRQLNIVQFGRAISKICPGIVIGTPLVNLFRIVTPDVGGDFDAIREQSFTVFFVEYLDAKLTLKGQMLYLEADDAMLFLCSPVIRELANLSEIGLELSDFAIHDSAVDFLILLQTKTNTINDVRKMAERLKQEVAVRREAEKSLLSVNEQLEQRVKDRTAELEATNLDLQREMEERQRIGEKLQISNANLNSMVTWLEYNNRQISALNMMGDMLQACRSVKESYGVIKDSIQQLFPTDSGLLALYDKHLDVYRVMASWGTLNEDDREFQRNDCWGLRRARLHRHDAMSTETVCGHIKVPPPNGYLCMPLTAQGELLGLLHLQTGDLSDAESEGSDVMLHMEVRQQMMQTAAEHISLAIANLQLQENLRQQSIRDTLTGLYNRRHMEESLEREISRSRRNGTSLGVVMIDVDHFKKFNDTLGHQAGDALLAALGDFLKRQVRGEDIPCRYGGEEFILILPGANAEGAAKRAEQIRDGVENALIVPFNGSTLPRVTISMGVADFPTLASNSGELVKAADAALYLSKQNGRNRVTIASVADAATERRGENKP